MDEEAAILAAITAHPEEDTPRLAYADWLDEHAGQLPDPAAARIRAEFIRLQCQIHRLEDMPAIESRRYAVLQGQVHLWRRQQEILERHRRDLLGPLGEELTDAEMNRDIIFDRGFVAELRLDAERFLKYADAIAALQPLPDVTVSDVAWWLDHLDDCPESLRLATAIDMQSERRPEPVRLGPDGVAEGFASYGPWARLRKLSLENCQIQDGGLGALARSDQFPALTDLDLSGNEISPEGVRLLVNAPLWPRLKHLVLGGNPLGDEAAEVLADAAAGSQLESLNLRFAGISTNGYKVLLGKFPSRTKLAFF